MRKTTKGALAAAAAGLLMLGGVGTHAAWSDDETATGTQLSTGHLAIVNWSCDAWNLVGTAADAVFDPAADVLVPGDVIKRLCTFTVDVEGKNIKASLAVDLPGLVDTTTGAPVSGLVASAELTDGAGQAITSDTVLTADTAVTAALKVSVPNDPDITVPQDLDATLDAISVSATQS